MSELRAAVLSLLDAVEHLPGWLPLAPVIALRCERVRRALKAEDNDEAEQAQVVVPRDDSIHAS